MENIELSYENERRDLAFDRQRALKFYNEQDQTRLWLRQLEPEKEKANRNGYFAKKAEEDDRLDLSDLAEFL